MSRTQSIPGRSLNGTELKTILLNDVSRILDQDGMMANHIAYSQVAYEVVIKLHLNNASYPEHTSRTVSRGATDQEIAKSPESGLESVEAFPMKDLTDETVRVGRKRDRKITSTNLARIENDIPIEIQVRQSDGSVETKKEIYKLEEIPEDYLKEQTPPDHGFTDTEIDA